MSSRLGWLVLIGLVAVVAAAGTAWAADPEQEVPTDQVVAEARITMVQAIDVATSKVEGGKAYSAELVMNDDGEPEYEVLLSADGRHVEVDVDAVNGKAIGVYDAKEEEAQGGRTVIDELPPAVQATIMQEADGGEIKNVITLYGVSVVKDGDEFGMIVTEDGVLAGEADVNEDDEDVGPDEDGMSLVKLPPGMEWNVGAADCLTPAFTLVGEVFGL